MHEITDRALDTARIRGASYADVRVVRRREESIDVKSGRLAGVLSYETEGFGIRVLVDGAWGFASSHGLTVAEADRVAAQAVRIARASATAVRRPVVLDDRPPALGRFETPVAEDPFAIPLEEKIGDLLAADEAMRRVDGIAFADTTYGAQREEKTFAASDGSFTEQVITHVGAGIEANAVDGAEHQRRSYPDAGGGWQGAGYEYVRSLDLAGTAERVATEAVQLLSAPQLPPGRRTIVLAPVAALPPGPRELRPSDRARPRLRHRGEPRRHELPDDRQARGGLPLRLGDRRHRGRRHGPRRDGHLRLGRRGRRGPGGAARAGRRLRRLPVESRDGAADRPALAAARCGRTAGTGSRSSA